MQRMTFRGGLAVAALATIGAVKPPSPLDATVLDGTLRGVAQNGAIAFLGVPYAAPPIGAARWRPPAPAAAWNGVRAATRFASSCPQVLNPAGGRAPWTPEYLIPGPMAEDCLYLNVWRPAAQTRSAPVLVFIHGGGGVEGSGSVPVYDGAAMARQGVVVVNFNYRLGVLGGLALPALSREQGGASGNYGLQDAIAALRWVRANISALGGDPERVTVAGQSAGAAAVTMLIASPEARGFFSRAITESGSRWGTRPGPASLAEGERQGTEFAESVGASTLAQLRTMPASALVRQAAIFAQAHVRVANVMDGKTVKVDYATAQARAGFNDTPILAGFNWNEDSGFDARYGRWTVAELARKRAALFGPLAAQAAAVYPAASDAEAKQVGELMSRDRSRAELYEWAKRRAGVSHQPIYAYLFRHPEPGPTAARYGTFHSSEVPYVFGNLNAARPFTYEDRQLSRRMMTRWLRFVRGGAPDLPDAAAWRPFTATKPEIMLLGDEEKPVRALSPAALDLSDRFANLTR